MDNSNDTAQPETYKPITDPGTAFPERSKPEPQPDMEFGNDAWVEASLRFIYSVAKSPALLEAANSYRNQEQ